MFYISQRPISICSRKHKTSCSRYFDWLSGLHEPNSSCCVSFFCSNSKLVPKESKSFHPWKNQELVHNQFIADIHVWMSSTVWKSCSFVHCNLTSVLSRVFLSEQQLEKSLQQFAERWELNPGDGAFYGPKVSREGRWERCRHLLAAATTIDPLIRIFLSQYRFKKYNGLCSFATQRCIDETWKNFPDSIREKNI